MMIKILKKPLSLLLLIFLLLPVSCKKDLEVVGKNGMVVSVDQFASQVGIDILKKGGNAVDAAVAVGFALAVTFPAAGNIGGGGFMIIRFPDTAESVAVDFREMAPGQATSEMYLDKDGQVKTAHSIAPGLDYPGVGPEHAFYHKSHRATYVSCTDKQALEGFETLTRTEGIIPALEPSHAIYYLKELDRKLKSKKLVIVCLSG